MYKVILALICVVLTVIGGLWIAEQETLYDFALVGLDGRVRSSIQIFPVAAGGGLILILALSAGRIWQFLSALPGRLAERRAAQRKERGYVALTKGLAAVAAGDARESANLAAKSKALLKDQKLTALLSAQSAQLQGKAGLATQEYQALLKDEETAFLGLRGLAMQALRDGEEAAALRHVRAAKAIKPNAPWVLDLLYQLELSQGHILQSAEAVKAARLNDLLPQDAARARLAPLYAAVAKQALAEGETDQALKLTAQSLEQSPGFLPATLIRARALLKAGKPGQAKSLTQKAWRLAPQPDLLALHMEAANVGEDTKARKRVAMNLMKGNSTPAGQLALGEFLLAELEMVPARAALEAAQDQGSIRATAILDEVASIERTLEMEEGASEETRAEAQQRAKDLVQIALSAPVEAGWVCAACGSEHPQWALTCSTCGEVGLIEWQTFSERRIVKPVRGLLEAPTLSGLK